MAEVLSAVLATNSRDLIPCSTFPILSAEDSRLFVLGTDVISSR